MNYEVQWQNCYQATRPWENRSAKAEVSYKEAQLRCLVLISAGDQT